MKDDHACGCRKEESARGEQRRLPDERTPRLVRLFGGPRRSRSATAGRDDAGAVTRATRVRRVHETELLREGKNRIPEVPEQHRIQPLGQIRAPAPRLPAARAGRGGPCTWVQLPDGTRVPA